MTRPSHRERRTPVTIPLDDQRTPVQWRPMELAVRRPDLEIIVWWTARRRPLRARWSDTQFAWQTCHDGIFDDDELGGWAPPLAGPDEA